MLTEDLLTTAAEAVNYCRSTRIEVAQLVDRVDGNDQVEVDCDRLAMLVCSFVRRLPIERQLVVRLNEAGRLVPVGAYAVTTVNALLKYLRGETAPSALAGDLAVDFAALPRHMQRRVEQVQLNLLMVNHDVLGQAYAEALAALLDVTEG